MYPMYAVYQQKVYQKKRFRRNIVKFAFLVFILFALSIGSEQQRQDKISTQKEIDRITMQKPTIHMLEIKQILGRW